jgi:methyl-accepting chemotaxis protein
VRALAQRSAASAREIKGLIEQTAGQVKQGVRLVHGSGEALGAIVRRVEEIGGLVQTMAALADEQTQSLMMVRMSIGELTEVTNDSVKIVSQAETASSAMSTEANVLQEFVSRFRVGGDDKRAARVSDEAQELEAALAAYN